MSFNYPLGLLALIGVPVLVIIYIIKNKYTEQVVPSTYLWTLSERFLKRKNPINRISGIISLVLQILTVIFIALAVAQPVFTLPGAADDYLFIIDGSGSMNIEVDGESRLDRAKDEAESLINSSANGSTYTIVYATSTADVVCEEIDTKKTAISRLESIEPAYGTSGVTAAMAKAQEVFSENPAVKIYFITDKNYETTQNVEIINVSSNEINYSITDAEYQIVGSAIEVTFNVWSYSGDAELTVELYVDGSSEAAASRTLSVTELEACAAALEYTFPTDGSGTAITAFESLTVRILEDDGLDIDNEVIIYNALSDSTYSVILVSDSPFFLQSALASIGSMQVDVVSTSEYTGKSGYGLYIFDGCTPDVLPSDGAVWFLNPQQSVTGSGFTVQSVVELESPIILSYSTSSSTRIKELLSGTCCDVSVIKYVKCGFYRSFYTLASYSGDSLIYAGTNTYGNREVVFAFDLHDSDITLTTDYIVLVSNLLGYTFPDVVDGTSFSCGDTVTVNVLAGCDSLRVEAPSGAVSYLDTSSDYAELELEEVGTYIITVIISGNSRQVMIYSGLAEEESYTLLSGDYFIVTGEASSESRDGRYDSLWYLYVILALLFIADWGVYCYEQYQLR